MSVLQKLIRFYVKFALYYVIFNLLTEYDVFFSNKLMFKDKMITLGLLLCWPLHIIVNYILMTTTFNMDDYIIQFTCTTTIICLIGFCATM